MLCPHFTKQEAKVKALWRLHSLWDCAGMMSQDLLMEGVTKARTWILRLTELDLNSGSAAQVTLANLCIFFFTQCPDVHGWDDKPYFKGLR